MAWFLLIVVLIAAALGVLGAVLKLAATLILAIVVVITVCAIAGWFWFKHWMRGIQEQADNSPGGTATGRRSGKSYDVQGWIHEETASQGPPTALPPEHPDEDND